MEKVTKVTIVEAYRLGRQIYVAAVGGVPTSGWSRPQLFQRIYLSPPADGIQDLDFVATPPSGIVLEVPVPISHVTELRSLDWMKGVRVISRDTSIEKKFEDKGEKIANVPTTAYNTIFRTTLAGFSDSIQPTGGTKLVVDGWSTRISAEFKKLNHEYICTIEGPDQGQAARCFQDALVAGFVAAIAAVYITGGSALGAATAAFLERLNSCLEDSFKVRIDDVSNWEYWWT